MTLPTRNQQKIESKYTLIPKRYTWNIILTSHIASPSKSIQEDFGGKCNCEHVGHLFSGNEEIQLYKSAVGGDCNTTDHNLNVWSTFPILGWDRKENLWFSFIHFSLILKGSTRPVTMFFQVLYNKGKRSCQDVHKEDRGNYHTGLHLTLILPLRKVFGMCLFLHQYVITLQGIVYPYIYDVNK